MRFSLGTGFSLYINTCVSKFVQFCCKGGRIGFMHPSKPLVGVAGGIYTRFALGFVCLPPPPPPTTFSLILVYSYRLLACGLACPVTHLLSPRPLLSERPLGIDCYRMFSHDVMAAMLVSQNNPLGVELFSYANAFFCSNRTIDAGHVSENTLYCPLFDQASAWWEAEHCLTPDRAATNETSPWEQDIKISSFSRERTVLSVASQSTLK